MIMGSFNFNIALVKIPMHENKQTNKKKKYFLNQLTVSQVKQ